MSVNIRKPPLRYDWMKHELTPWLFEQKRIEAIFVFVKKFNFRLFRRENFKIFLGNFPYFTTAFKCVTNMLFDENSVLLVRVELSFHCVSVSFKVSVFLSLCVQHNSCGFRQAPVLLCHLYSHEPFNPKCYLSKK